MTHSEPVHILDVLRMACALIVPGLAGVLFSYYPVFVGGVALMIVCFMVGWWAGGRRN